MPRCDFRWRQRFIRIPECHGKHRGVVWRARVAWPPIGIQMIGQMYFGLKNATFKSPDDRMNKRVWFFAEHIVLAFHVQRVPTEIAILESDCQIRFL